ncbi:AAA family ATPase [Methanococcus vannielii]|nr:AAA family ATPase [Methanococcus vannielii]
MSEAEILSFGLKNVKSFKYTGNIDLKPITIFIGPNNSGKSSLLRFLAVMGQTFTDDDECDIPLRFNGSLIDYGRFQSIPHFQNGNEIEFNLKLNLLSMDILNAIESFIRDTVNNLESWGLLPDCDKYELLKKNPMGHTTKKMILNNPFELYDQIHHIDTIYRFEELGNRGLAKLLEIFSEDVENLDEVMGRYSELLDSAIYNIDRLSRRCLDSPIKNIKKALENIDLIFSLNDEMNVSKFELRSNNNLIIRYSEKTKSGELLGNSCNLNDLTFYGFLPAVEKSSSYELLKNFEIPNKMEKIHSFYEELIKHIFGVDLSVLSIFACRNLESFKDKYGDFIQIFNENPDILAQFLNQGINLGIYHIIIDKLKNEFDNINVNYIGPFRKVPERIYPEIDYVPDSVGPLGENAAYILDKLNGSDDFHKIDVWLRTNLGCNLIIEDYNDSGNFSIKSANTTRQADDLVDMGYGISQILPILTMILVNFPKNKDSGENMYLIEQPELHLHPAVHGNLADLFVDKTLNDNKSSKMIIETHSEYLLKRLQELVLDPNNPITEEDISVYYVNKDKEWVSDVKKVDFCKEDVSKILLPSEYFNQP